LIIRSCWQVFQRRCTAHAANTPPVKPLMWPIQLTPAGENIGINDGKTPP
jgi:hypothetical protein